MLCKYWLLNRKTIFVNYTYWHLEIVEVDFLSFFKVAPRFECPTWISNLEWTRYRESLKCAQRAGKHFQAENVDLVLQLGDILDGKSGENVKRDLLDRVLPALKCTTQRKFDGSECSEYGSGVFRLLPDNPI